MRKSLDVGILLLGPLPSFIDDDGHLFENAIEWLANEGITKGCNPPVNDKFCPDDFVTRGQMAAFLKRALT
ncbi:MAG: S-layer homology domain-containing protein [Acidobacteria bacterium]|nr:S-layer homology domain-containing protein [Acidobacteriota bacterium]